MELKLVNGEYVPDTQSGAGFETVAGTSELIQRIMFKLKARRGGFPFLPELGSDLWRLYKEKKSNRLSAAYKYVCEALSDESDVRINGVMVSETGDKLKVNVELNINDNGASISVEI